MIDVGGLFAKSAVSMTARTRNRLIAFSIMAAPFIFLLCLLLFWDAEPPPTVPPLPNPNGYEDLVKAGEMIKGEVWDYDKADLEKLRGIVSTNTEALMLARTALTNQCAVPLRFSRDNLTNHLHDVLNLKNLAQAFATEGRLAGEEGHVGAAVKAYLDVIHLGNQVRHGGILIDGMIGTAMESIGVEHLQKLVDQMDAKACQQTAAQLETLDSQRPAWDEIMQQERDWSRRTFPGIRYEIVRLMEHNSVKKILSEAEQNYKKQQSQTHQLIVEFAARAYALDKGHSAANLADLVPHYLKTIPQDPFTSTNMVYAPR